MIWQGFITSGNWLAQHSKGVNISRLRCRLL